MKPPARAVLRLLCPLLLLASLSLSPSVAQADCPAAVSALSLSQDISLADAAFADMDSSAFSASRSASLRDLPCVNESLTTTTVSAFHRMQGLAGFLNRDQAGSIAAFRALLAVSPGFALSETVAPEGHPLRSWFETAMVTPSGAPHPFTPPKKGWVYVDGKIATESPSDRPFIVQVFDSNGAIILTALVPAGGALPAFPTPDKAVAQAGTSKAGSGLTPPPSATRPRDGVHLNAPMLGVAGVLALASGGLYFAASGEADRFWDPDTAPNQLDTLRQQTNTLAGLSVGLGALALGAGTASFFVGTW